MNVSEIVEQAKRLRSRIQAYARDETDSHPSVAAQAQVCDFLRQYAGAKSAFVKQAEAAEGYDSYRVRTLTAIIESFVEYLEAGLGAGLSPERRAQLDVVSDILGQAQVMLESDVYHPSAPAVLVGASLEEFSVPGLRLRAFRSGTLSQGWMPTPKHCGHRN